MAFYTAKVEFEIETGKQSKSKKVKETYLVEAVSVTDAETIVHKKFGSDPIPFEVKSVTASNIIEVLK